MPNIGEFYTQNPEAADHRHLWGCHAGGTRLNFFRILDDPEQFDQATNKPKGLYFGCEIEWDFLNSSTADKFNRAYSWLFQKYQCGNVTSDGSLNNHGIELQICPMRFEALEEFASIMPWPTHGMLSSTQKQGLHVNINASYFRRREQVMLFKALFMRNKSKIAPVARRSENSYCEYNEGWQVGSGNSKYHAVNTGSLEHSGRYTPKRVEVRVFKTPLNPDQLLQSLTVVKNLADFAKSDITPHAVYEGAFPEVLA